MDSSPENLDWSPLNAGGSNYRTRKLNRTNNEQWVYEPTGMHKAFPLIFIWGGLFFAIVLLITIIGFFGGIIFMVIGIIWRRRMKRLAIVFDFGQRAFWKGNKKYDPRSNWMEVLDEFIKFDDLIGIQLLEETVVRERQRSDRDRRHGPVIYDSYEMNLVHKNGSRINVVDHGNFNMLKQEADAIAERLKLPVWEAVK